MQRPCVARYDRKTDSIHCGIPDKAWTEREDYLSVRERKRRRETGDCRKCLSYSLAKGIKGKRRSLFFLSLLLLAVLLLQNSVHAQDRPCLNPISTVDWSLFVDKLKLDGTCICTTDTSVKIGLKWQVPEPIAFIDVSRKAYDYVCLGMKMSDTMKMGGGTDSKQGIKRNIHYIKYPVFGILNLIYDYLCIDKTTTFDISPPSELDPRQNDDELSALFEPEKLLYANPIAQATGGFYDCIVSSTGSPANWAYWNAGCWGTLGNVVGNSPGADPVTEAALLAAKQIDLLHADFQLWKYSDADGLDYVASVAQAGNVVDTTCSPVVFPRIIKSQYYLNLAYPVAWKAVPIGDFPLKWAFFKQYPGDGEDFVFSVWRIRNCCAGFQFP